MRSPKEQYIYPINQPSDIEIYLQAYGYHKLNEHNSSMEKLPVRQFYFMEKLKEFMEKNYNKAQAFVTCLNYHACQNKNNTYPYTVELSKNQNQRYKTWLNTLHDMKDAFIRYDEDTAQVTWNCEEDLNFVMGGWFEVFVGYQCFLAFKKDEYPKLSLKNIHIGLQFEKNNSPNEADVCFVHEGVFYFIECKTNNWKGQTTEVNRYISHLDSTSKFGLNCKKLFVSLYPISDKSHLAANNRDVDIVCGEKVLDIKSFSNI